MYSENLGTLSEKLAKKSGMTKNNSRKVIKDFLDIIGDSLVEVGRINLIGYFSLELSERKERKGRNPKTGEEIVIPASKVVKFSASSTLKEKINK